MPGLSGSCRTVRVVTLLRDPAVRDRPSGGGVTPWHPYWWLPTAVLVLCLWFEAVTP